MQIQNHFPGYQWVCRASVALVVAALMTGCSGGGSSPVAGDDPGDDVTPPDNGISVNGLPLTEDFDLAVYIKGDKKPVVVKDAQLILEYKEAGATETQRWESEIHTFSVDDVMGGFDGTTFADTRSIICGLAESKDTACPQDAAQPLQDSKTNTMLYPIDSEFGFYIQDFTGAAEKDRDGDYAEGWIGNFNGGGVMVSNADTAVFQTGQNRGTWCAGVGGEAVKCSTEHYVVMEAIQTCYESVPTNAAGTQRSLLDPANGAVIGSCTDKALDDTLKIVSGGVATDAVLTSAIPGNQMDSNESTVRDNIAVAKSYSVTLKDDGKPLYRWGNVMKRPNDVRMYARIALPDEWKQRDADGNLVNSYEIVSAKLQLHHWISNNPNDQVRPEDLENEGATGVLPDYLDNAGMWTSDKVCYAGNGDLIPTGAVFKNPGFADAGAFSSDLIDGFSHYWYTTTDRDPFEWSYALGGSALPSDTLGELASGPRWRLKANKFGQDIPGLEIPATNCDAPPFTSDSLKYEVGSETTTVLNLLDYDADAFPAAPLGTSTFWVGAEGGDV